MPETPLDFSIVMPCLNEVGTLAQCIERSNEAVSELNKRHGFNGEIIVADNGSTDGSQQLAESMGARVTNVEELGYGAALKGGFDNSNGRFLVMGDSDCSYDFAEAVPMVEKLADGADICMGSRFAGEIKPNAMPWKNKYIGNPVLSWLLRLFYRTNVGDAHCGLRALTRECYDRLDLKSDGMEFASEMILKATILNERIEEVPVTLWPDKRDRPPHLRPWRDGWRHLRLMLMLSPMWLFIVPSLLFAAFGLFLFGALLAQPTGTMVEVGPFRFGDHWLSVASALVIIAAQLGLFGCIAILHGFLTGLRPVTESVRRVIALFRLEYVMIGAFLIFLTGLAIVATIAVGWIGAGAGPLNALREMIAGSTLVVVGVQTFFAGFLIAILGGTRGRIQLGDETDTEDRLNRTVDNT
ncbi:MAG: glycosyltransferase family 2 protein [Boseongicola sp.]